jgi:methyl-accepting chemotaxis protein
MRKTNIIIISLCLSVFILTSVVHADLLIPGSSSKDTRASIKDTNASIKDTNASIKDTNASIKDTGTSTNDTGTSTKDTGASIKDTSTSTKDGLNSLLIISAVIIGIVALIAWLVIRKIKK